MSVQYCSNHNEPILFFDANIFDQKKERMSNLKTIEQEDYEKQKAFDQLKQQPQMTILALQKLIDEVNEQKRCINVAFDKLICQLMQEIEIIEQLNNQSSSKLSIDDFKKQINDQNQVMKKLIMQQLQNFKLTIKIDKIKNSLKELTFISKMEMNQSMEYLNYKYKSFEYELLDKGYKNKLKNVGLLHLIKMQLLYFIFENGYIMNEIQELNGHIGSVTCLNYMNQSDELVSASDDKSIIVWNRNEEGQWMIKQRLCEHSGRVICLIQNQFENVLISGSDDNSIKFRLKKNKNWIFSQTIKTTFFVEALSLDEDFEQLIACGYKGLEILIITKVDHYEWIINKAIQVKNYRLRLCFINPDMFVFQPNDSEFLEIYKRDKQLDEFVKRREIKVKSSKGSNILFPSQFIQSREILLVKNNSFLNILR